MKKFFFVIVLSTIMILQAFAGGLVSNTNQSASYYRMLARGASTDADAVYYNPAGLAFLEQGFTFSLNTQMIWMKRNITSEFPSLNNPKFEGTLFVPFYPGVYAAYKTGQFTFSLGFNPPAGGGSIEFAHGLPMLERDVSMIPGTLSNLPPPLTTPTNNYEMESYMKGSSIFYAGQAGVSYRLTDMIGVSAGVRMMFANNSYEGYLRNIRINPNGNWTLATDFFKATGDGLAAQAAQATAGAAQAAAGAAAAAAAGDDALAAQLNETAVTLTATAAALNAASSGMLENSESTKPQSLDVKQKGNGFAPILGVHFNLVKLQLSAKYEFRTKVVLTNETIADVGMYPDAVKTRSDVPAILSLAGSYEIIPALKFSAQYVHHFETKAKIQDGTGLVNRQDFINGGTNEILAGLEFKLNDRLILSTGCQYSMVNVSDLWQNDITHNLTNFTLGLGAAFNINEKITLNIGGLNTWYNESFIEHSYTTYNRTNKAIALGIDFRF